jgi:ElaB/YqjD/DUF883 family membrane-anchored ribosome-binding protein
MPERQDQTDTERSFDSNALAEKARQAGEDVRRAGASTQALASAVRHSTEERVALRPYSTIAFAAAAGYVLGGGLSSRLTGTMLVLGGRIAVRRLLSEAIGGQRRPPGPIVEPSHH